MRSMTRQYSETARQAGGVAEGATDRLEKGTEELADRLPALVPRVNLVPAVEHYFDFLQRLVNLNRGIAVRWARAVGKLSGEARKQAESAGEAVRERAEAAGEAVRERAEAFERAAEETAEKAEKAEKAEQERAREARRIERMEAKQAHEKARARYEGMTKAELSHMLAQRDLPKSGNVDELVERLVEADGK